MSKVSPELLLAIKRVTGKRPRIVLDHILKHGHITTEELKDRYGYNHPPRAARDVREEGIPLETFRVVGSDGRKIGAYRLGEPSKIERHKLGGRQTFSKKLRKNLYASQSGRCAICHQPYEIRYLQIDHRVPYEVAGDAAARMTETAAFLLICASCQRSKSWSCEHCENWIETKSVKTCSQCYWASPENYEHIAGQRSRREVVIWSDEEIEAYDALAQNANKAGLTIAQYLKRVGFKSVLD